MKHSFGILCILVSFFLVSQVIGLLVTSQYIDFSSSVNGVTVWKSLPQLGSVPFERPDVNPNVVPIYLLFGILVGTLFVWFFSRIQSVWLWKIWFFSAVFMCLYISFFSFMNQKFALAIALLLSALKVFRPSVIVHNLSDGIGCFGKEEEVYSESFRSTKIKCDKEKVICLRFFFMAVLPQFLFLC